MAKVFDLFGRELRPDEAPGPRLSQEGRRLASDLSEYSVKALSSFYGALTGVRDLKGSKSVILDQLADLLDFQTQEGFDAFFTGLSPWLKEALRSAAFERYVDVKALESRHGVQIVSRKKNEFYNMYDLILNASEGADLFLLADEATLLLALPLRSVFARWLPKPDGYTLKPAENPVGDPWSNVDSVRELIPLMVEAASDAFKGMDAFQAARKGLSKTSIKKARAACGQASFPVAGIHGLDSIDLFARALNCLFDAPVRRLSDGDEFIKHLADRFFTVQPSSRASPYRPQGGYLEYLVLIDHLTRRNCQGSILTFPTSRITFRRVLGEIAGDGRWYSLDDIHRFITLRGEPFAFCDPAVERDGLTLKGQRLQIGDLDLQRKTYEEYFPLTIRLRAPILERPLLKAYCYLFAIFGIVDIREADPDNPLIRSGKKIPISPYDGLTCVRVTDFGAWCLGIRASKPPRAKREYEAIADKELLLVTFKGHSLERKLFLEAVGDKLGTDRYRITEASFIRGCESKGQIEERIRKFKNLIEPEPSERWERFFATVRSRASLFADPEPALLFRLPADLSTGRFLMQDPQLRSLVIKAEGNRVVVRGKDYRKFLKLLAERGFFNPEA